jgi:uncharacterized membrane protein YhhN
VADFPGTWRTTLLRAAILLAVLGGIWPVLAASGGFAMHWLFAASGLFVLLGLCGRWNQPAFRIPFRLGLVACAAGDVLGPRNFHWGVACFLLAHLAFCVGCLGHGVAWSRLLRWSPVILAVSFGLVGLWLWPHLPERDRPLIVAYTAVISVMAWLAAGLRPSALRPWLWTGAWIFYLSDIFVARWRFVDPSAANGLVCYPLYYLACTLLARAVGRDLPPSSPPTSGVEEIGSHPESETAPPA